MPVKSHIRRAADAADIAVVAECVKVNAQTMSRIGGTRWRGARWVASMKNRWPGTQQKGGPDRCLATVLGDEGAYLGSEWFGRLIHLSLG
jgi:hypothetical protein